MKTEIRVDRCPKCGAQAYVQGTSTKGHTKYRYRVCTHCGFRYKTKFTEIFCTKIPNTENCLN